MQEVVTVIRTRIDYTKGIEPIYPQRLFSGTWPLTFLPRKGDLVTIWDGWVSHRVYEVWHNISDNTVDIVLDVLPCDEFAKEIEKRKIRQR